MLLTLQNWYLYVIYITELVSVCYFLYIIGIGIGMLFTLQNRNRKRLKVSKSVRIGIGRNWFEVSWSNPTPSAHRTPEVVCPRIMLIL